jgi:hypothetical protein
MFRLGFCFEKMAENPPAFFAGKIFQGKQAWSDPLQASPFAELENCFQK